MLEKPLYAPGCYGLYFAKDVPELCGGCVFRKDCTEAREIKRAQLQSFYGVKAPTRVRGELPLRPKKLFEELGKTEEEVVSAMREGQNPYSVTDSHVGLVAHLILQFGTVKRSSMTQVLKIKRGLNDTTAEVYVRYAVQILKHCGAVEQDGDEVKLAV